jgi:hypothetical protein
MPAIPSTVPYGADQTVYLVVNGIDRVVDGTDPGDKVSRENSIERTNLESVVSDLMSGQFNDPIRVVAFNTLEHWSDDVSRDVAREIQCRCDIEGGHVPDYLEEFIGRNIGHTRSQQRQPRGRK